MGRLTPSFRQVYTEVMDELRTEIRNALVDPDNKEAFNSLYKEAWHPEEAAMGQSSLPTVLNKLCMVANIHSRKLIEVLKDEISKRQVKIESIQNKIEALETKDGRTRKYLIYSKGVKLWNLLKKRYKTLSEIKERKNVCINKG